MDEFYIKESIKTIWRAIEDIKQGLINDAQELRELKENSRIINERLIILTTQLKTHIENVESSSKLNIDKIWQELDKQNSILKDHSIFVWDNVEKMKKEIKEKLENAKDDAKIKLPSKNTIEEIIEYLNHQNAVKCPVCNK